jgi:hypothetical protein
VSAEGDAFDAIAAALRAEGLADEASGWPRAFGSTALKVRGKIFAMPMNGALVLKLPGHRVEALIASGDGAPFTSGQGRPMKEWVTIAGAKEAWMDLAREAREFVAGVASGRS